MGGNQSNEQKITTAENNIYTLHQDIKNIKNDIEEYANEIITAINKRNYNDVDKLCQQLSWHYTDRLSSHFNIETLDGVRYNLDLMPTEDIIQKLPNKESTCISVSNFYKKKIKLYNDIIEALPTCINIEQQIYNNLSEKLKSQQINTQEWSKIYNKMNEFNKDIKMRYVRIKNLINVVRKAQNNNELNIASEKVIKKLQTTIGVCKMYENELLHLKSEIPSTFKKEKIVSEKQDIQDFNDKNQNQNQNIEQHQTQVPKEKEEETGHWFGKSDDDDYNKWISSISPVDDDFTKKHNIDTDWFRNIKSQNN